MDKHIQGTWEEFEALIRETIGSDLRWCIRPQDTTRNREMVASLILKDIESGNGVFSGKNAFIERI